MPAEFRIYPAPDQIVYVPAGTLVKFDDVDLFVSAGRIDPLTQDTARFDANGDRVGQPWVTINTEEAPAHDVSGDKQPILEVMLGDAILYDKE